MKTGPPRRRPGRPALADLHTHSTASDGSLAPAEVVRLAAARGLRVLALTDHDTLAGLGPAAEEATRHDELVFVPGIEVSAALATVSLHVLGLGIDAECPALIDLADRLLAARRQRNPEMIRRLRELGVPIDDDDVRAIAGVNRAADSPDVISRLHMARAIVQTGYAESVDDAFSRYVGKGAPAYVEKDRLPPAEVAAAIHAAGGAAVVAHPVHMGYSNHAQLERLIRGLQHAGLDGVEVYHSDHDAVTTRACLDMARKLGLIVTGGSDFHGSAKPTVSVGRPRVPLGALPDRLGNIDLAPARS